MQKNKNVVEDALFQIKNLEEAIQENAKGILHSTMKEEIKQLVKESLNEQDDDEVKSVSDDETISTGEEGDDEMLDDEDSLEDVSANLPMGDEGDIDDEEVINMTKAPDSEVLRVFKAMGPDDGIIVQKEDDMINIKDGDKEYMIKLAESEEMSFMDKFKELDSEEMGEDFSFEDDSETIYEIEVGSGDDEDGDDFNMFDDDDNEDEYFFENASVDGPRGAQPNQAQNSEMSEDDERTYEIEFSDEDDDEDDDEEFDFELDESWYSHDEYERMRNFGSEDELQAYQDRLVSGGEKEKTKKEDGEKFTSLDDAIMEAIKKSAKPKGVGIGSGPKFKYGKTTDYPTKKQKSAFGNDSVKAKGTGKAKFEYDEEVNMDGYSEKKPKRSVKKVETKEASRTLGAGRYWGKPGLPKPKAAPAHLRKESVDREVSLLREKNDEYKKALDVFRNKLNEVAVFNSNLAYATRLFTEHSTTKQEKINILRRFDSVETLKESKNLYRTIKDELGSTSKGSETTLKESFERNVVKTPSTGSSTNLIESKTYENPQFMRMKDLMSKLK